MDVKESGQEHVDWINLAHNMDNRWSIANIATIRRVLQYVRKVAVHLGYGT
jgi:hypothetical protein